MVGGLCAEDTAATAGCFFAAQAPAIAAADAAAKRILRRMRVPPRDGARLLARHYHRQFHALRLPLAAGHRPPNKNGTDCRSGIGATVVVMRASRPRRPTLDTGILRCPPNPS